MSRHFTIHRLTSRTVVSSTNRTDFLGLLEGVDVPRRRTGQGREVPRGTERVDVAEATQREGMAEAGDNRGRDERADVAGATGGEGMAEATEERTTGKREDVAGATGRRRRQERVGMAEATGGEWGT